MTLERIQIIKYITSIFKVPLTSCSLIFNSKAEYYKFMNYGVELYLKINLTSLLRVFCDLFPKQNSSNY